MEQEKITYQYADLGHWLARCNHHSNIIELNAREYDSLSPLMKDYVWVHECVHLILDVHDEAMCNKISDDVFVSRAKNERDRISRIDFIASANDQSFTRMTKTISGDYFFLLIVLFILFFIIKK